MNKLDGLATSFNYLTANHSTRTYEMRTMATDNRNTSQLLSNTFGGGLCPGRPLESVPELDLLPARNQRPLDCDDASTYLKDRFVSTNFQRITINRMMLIAQLRTAISQ